MKAEDRLSRILKFIPAVIWMAVIYWLSDRPADMSTEQSEGLTRQLVRFYAMAVDMPENRQLLLVARLEPYIRKLAHMTEYAVLFLLLYLALRQFAGIRLKAAFAALVICAAYAALDEWHQTFVYGRSGKPGDVAIDTAGALAAFVLLALVTRIRASRRLPSE